MKFKKRTILIVAIFIVAASIGTVLYAKGGTTNAEVGKLQVFKGTAEIIRGDKTTNGLTGTPVLLKDRIKVAAAGTTAVILKDNTIIRLEGGSEAEVAQLSYKDGKIKDAVLKLTNGRAWSRVQPVQSDSKFEVETPTATAAVRGTSFNTTFKNQITGIYVYHHTVEVTLNSTASKQTVPQSKLLQMKQGSLQEDFAKGSTTPPSDFFDEWIKFNQQQDDMLCKQLHDLPECDEKPAATKPKTEAKKSETPATPNYYQTPMPTPPPAPATLRSLAVSCSPVPATQNYQCTATARLSDGSTSNVTNQTAWTVLDPQNGTISQSGFYTRNPNSCPGDTVKGVYKGKQNTAVIPPVPNCG